MAAGDARPVPRRNVAYRVTFPILDADGDLVTGAAGLDSEVSKDGGTFADATSEATEIATASGMYFLDLTATEMDADTVAIIVKTSTVGAKTTPIVLYPESIGDYRVDVQQWLGAAPDVLSSGKVPADVKLWLAVAPDALSSGKVAADLKLWLAAAPNALNSGTVQADVQRWLNVVVNALLQGRVQAHTGTAVGTADSGSTTTVVDAERTEADADYWKGSIVVFTSGTLAGQARLITGFDPATDTITFAPATTVAVGTHTYIILPTGRVDLHLWLGAVVDALSSGKVPADVKLWLTTLPDVLSSGKVASDLKLWLAAAPNALIAGRVDANAQVVGDKTGYSLTQAFPTNFASMVIDGAGIVDADVRQWLGAVVNALIAGRVDANAQVVGDKIGYTLTAAERDNIIKAVSGTADAGGSTTTIVDAERTEADTDYWKDSVVVITSGAAIGQIRRISAFNAATDTITVDTAFTQTIAAGDTYLILRTAMQQAAGSGATDWTAAERNQIRDALGVDGTKTAATGGQVQNIRDAVIIRRNTAQAGAAGSITLDAGASATDDLFNDQWIVLVSGTGAGQVRLISDYVGSTQVASITPNWQTNPNATTVFTIIPAARVDLALWLGAAVNALIAGRVDVNMQAVGADVITAASIATDAIGAAEFSQAAADKVWASATRTLTAFSTALAVAVWDVLEANILTASSIGFKVKALTFTIANKVDASIQAAGDFAQGAADKVWLSASRTLTSLGAALVAEIWNALTSGMTTAGSIGKKLADWVLGTDNRALISADLHTAGVTVKAVTDPVSITSNVKKNQALSNFEFLMTDATTHLPKTGLTVAGQISKDGGAFASLTNAVVEVSNGIYRVDITAAELNANVVTLRFTAATADDLDVTIVTTP